MGRGGAPWGSVAVVGALIFFCQARHALLGLTRQRTHGAVEFPSGYLGSRVPGGALCTLRGFLGVALGGRYFVPGGPEPILGDWLGSVVRPGAR